jgi:hypothetical protein
VNRGQRRREREGAANKVAPFEIVAMDDESHPRLLALESLLKNPDGSALRTTCWLIAQL